MLKFKKLLKQVVAITCALAILICGVPMVASAEEVIAATDTLQLTDASGAGATYHPGGSGSPIKTFAATPASMEGWENNHRVVFDSAANVSEYDTISFNYSFTDQAGYDYWKNHSYFYVGGVEAYYPMPTDLEVGDNTVTLDLNLAAKKGYDLSAIGEIGVKTVWGNEWFVGDWHWGPQCGLNTGWRDDSGNGIDFTFSITNVTANKVDTPSGTVELDAGAYMPWGSRATNLSWANFSPLSFETAIDISVYDYLEFDVYVSDADSLRAETDSTGAPVWAAYALGLQNSAGQESVYAVSTDNFKTGFNRVSIPVSSIPSYISTDLKHSRVWQEHNPVAINPSKNYMLGTVNFKGVKAPEMNNNYDVSVYEVEGTKTVRSYAEGTPTIWDPSYPTLTWDTVFIDEVIGTLDTEDTVDVSAADYMEFDIYASHAMPAMSFFLSSNKSIDESEEAGRRGTTLPALERGWNHICLPLNSTAFPSSTNDWNLKSIKTYFIVTNIDSTENVVGNVGLAMANIAFTYDSNKKPEIKDLQILKGDGTEGAIYHPGGSTSPTKTFYAANENLSDNNRYMYMAVNNVLGYDNLTFNFNIANQDEYDYWKYHVYIYLQDANNKMAIYPMPTNLKQGDNTITLDLHYAKKCGLDLTNLPIVGIKSVPVDAWHDSHPNYMSMVWGYTNTDGIDFTFTTSNFWVHLEDEADNIDRIDAGNYRLWGNPVANLNWANITVLNPEKPVDLSAYDYLEFDIYVSDADKLRAELGTDTGAPVWSDVVLRFINSNGDTQANWWHWATSTADLKTGYNHFRIPTNEIPASHVSDLASIYMYNESNGATISPAYNYVLGAVNFTGVNTAAKIDGVYADDMMFQQNKPIAVTGSGTVGAEVMVELVADKDSSVVRTGTTTIPESGIWEIQLESLTASFDTYTLNFYVGGAATPEKTVKNVIIGELYVASGQSNMAMRMWETPEGADWYNNNTYGVNGNANIRVFSMNDTFWNGADVPYEPDRNAVVGYWAVGNEADYYDVSAVAYNFADTMQKKLGIPVGVMDVSLGGSSIFPWISREAIEADAELLAYLKEKNLYYDESNWGGTSSQQQMTSLYNIKVAPISSMYVSGAIWYQGCSEVGVPDGIYTRALEVLRDCFADTFNYTEAELPFILVELHAYGFADPALPKMWDQMTAAAENNENMGAVTIYDLPLDWDYSGWAPFGAADPIHPFTKKPVGQRLANAMYAMVYDSEYGESTAPVWNGNITFQDGAAYLDFDHVGDGLATPDGIALDGFSITDARGVFVNAKAEIVDKDTVKVWSDNVANPVAVSYCYDNYSLTSNLYGTQNGDVFLPAAPFITTTDAEITYAQNNSWYAVDDATLQHITDLKFGFYDAWTAQGATAEIVTDVKDYGDGSLKLTYTGEADTFYAAPTLTGADDAIFSDINYNYSFYDRIDFKVKNVGSAITLDKLALYSNGVWYYAEIDTALSADSGWVAVTANLNNLVDENGNTYENSNKLSAVTKMQIVFSDVTAAGSVYVDTFQLGNSTYGEFKLVPNEVTTANVGSMGVSFNYGAVTNTGFIGDTYLMYNADGVDVSNSDYIEFDLYINDIDEVKRLQNSGYSFAMWISANPGAGFYDRFANRCNFSIDDQLTKTGWNHIVIKLSDIVYMEDGFTFEHLHYFYITCNNSTNEPTSTSLYVKLTNFVHTVHAGDLTADGELNVLDLIRMKKVELGEDVEHDALSLDVDRNGINEAAIDFVALRKKLFKSF